MSTPPLLTLPVLPPADESAAPRVLVGETYCFTRTGQPVTVIDHEYRPVPRRPRSTSPVALSAHRERTGRFIVRYADTRLEIRLAAAPDELAPLNRPRALR